MDEELSTESFAEMLDGDQENDQPETESQNEEPEQEVTEEAAPEEEEQTEEPETESVDALIEVEINGEKLQLSKDEIKNGYLRQQDYTQKTQNFAKEVQSAQTHLQQQFQQVQQMSVEIGQLSAIDSQLQQYSQVNWQALRESDPLSYSTHLAEMNDLRARRADVTQQIGQKQQALTQHQHEIFAAQSREAEAHLRSVVPNFGKDTIEQMKAFGMKHGFGTEELASVSDKRMLEVLYKASQYDAMQQKTKQVVKKISALPTKANKPAAPAAPAAQLNIDKQRKRVAETGSVRDFAALLSMRK